MHVSYNKPPYLHDGPTLSPSNKLATFSGMGPMVAMEDLPRRGVISLYHNSLTARHPGVYTTIHIYHYITMDFIVKLPTSNSYDTILTITDTLSKASIFILCKETTDAENTTLLYATYVLPHYGLPSQIISDCEPQFTATFTKELCQILKVDQNISTAYHPQIDSQSEQTNQCLEQYLCIFIDYHQND